MVSDALKSQHANKSKGPIFALAFGIGLVAAVIVFIAMQSGSKPPQIAPTVAKKTKRAKPAPIKGDSEPRVVRHKKETRAAPVLEPDLISVPDYFGSKFQQRLQFGDFVKQLQQLLKKETHSPEQVVEAFSRAMDAHLTLDNLGEFSRLFLREEGGRLSSVLESGHLEKLLSWVAPLNRKALNLSLSFHTDRELKEAEKRWATKALLRVWTKSKHIETFNINEAERMLQQLHGIAKVSLDEDHHGYDAIVGSGLGSEFFPNNALQSYNAQGVYVIKDDLAVVRYQPSMANTEAVLKHELVHAFTFGLDDQFESSRFVSEGLAEYLRLMQQHEELRGPPDVRYANEARALLSMIRIMKAQGVNLAFLDFSKLLSLPPSSFYELGPFGYLMAQTAMAATDWPSIVRALQTRRDLPIVDSLRRMDFASFEIFLESIAAKERKRIFTVSDRVADGKGSRPKGFKRIMRELGVKIPRDSLDPNVFNVTSKVSSGAGSARDFLNGDEIGAAIFLTDSSDHIANYFQLADFSKVPNFELVTQNLAASTGRLFVENLYYALQAKYGLRQEGAIGAMHSNLKDAQSLKLSPPPILTERGSTTFVGLSQRLSAWQRENNAPEVPLVISIGSRDEEARSRIKIVYKEEITAMPEDEQEEFISQTLRLYYQGLADRAGFSAGPILVIDLAKGESDAAILADALMEVYASKGLTYSVTLWDPQSQPSQ